MRMLLSLCLLLCCFSCFFASCDNGDAKDGDSQSSNSSSVSNLNNSVYESSGNADIEYSLEHLSKAVKAWQNFSNYGLGCELEFAYGDNSALEHLNAEQQAWVCDVQGAVCCSSKHDAKNHIERYVSVGMYKSLDDELLLEHNGGLYCLIGAKGFIEFDTELKASDVVRTAYNKLNVTTETYGSGGELYCLDKFDFEYIDGAYKIVAVTDIELDDKNDNEDQTDGKDDEQISSQSPAKPMVDYSKFCGEYIDGNADMGPCYSFVLKSVEPKTQKATFSVNYIGRNASPIYTTDYVTAVIGDNGKTTFSWEDNWENKGVGEFTLCDDGKLSVKLKMTVTRSAESNRATLGTEGIRTLCKE